LVVTLAASISISTVDCSGTSAMRASPRTCWKRPRTLAIRWRATNSNDWWDGSIVQVPTAADVLVPSLMLGVLPWSALADG
jgi:hypothetical protein